MQSIYKASLVLILSSLLLACSNDEQVTQPEPSAKPQELAEAADGEVKWIEVEGYANRNNRSQVEQAIAPSNKRLEDRGDGLRDDESNRNLAAANAIAINDGTVGYVQWETPAALDYESAKLTIVGPDGNARRIDFAGGESMMVNETLPDGLYKWESVVTPSIDPYAKAQLSDARASGNIAEQASILEDLRAQGLYPSTQEIANNRQSGVFVVSDGEARATSAEASRSDSD